MSRKHTKSEHSQQIKQTLQTQADMPTETCQPLNFFQAFCIACCNHCVFVALQRCRGCWFLCLQILFACSMFVFLFVCLRLLVWLFGCFFESEQTDKQTNKQQTNTVVAVVAVVAMLRVCVCVCGCVCVCVCVSE